MDSSPLTLKRFVLALVVLAVAVGAAAALGGWKWKANPTQTAGWTWDDPTAAPYAGSTA
jgi:hypothetical protein